VPIALESATGDTEEGRDFFQSRLALHGGWMTLIAGSFLAVSSVLSLLGMPRIDASNITIGNPDLYHAGIVAVAAALWVVARWCGPLSMKLLQWLEAAVSFLICALVTVMSAGWAQAHMAIAQDVMHGVLAGILGCCYVLMSRAIALPSTPLRTAIVSAVCMLPMVAFAATLPTRPGPGVEVSAFTDVLTWSLMTVAMAVVASRVIYGLRAEINKVKRLGQYTLEGKLGEGGMGVVYRASHAMLRRPTAIKLLKTEMAGGETIRRSSSAK
jgi:serine/threonine-protein kinase